MKLPFTDSPEGNDELNNILGFTSNDLKVSRLWHNLVTAADQIILYIGRPMYDSIVGIYEQSSHSTADSALLARLQYALALDGYRNFAQDNDLTHGLNGRTVTVEQNQRQPWEWQVERSNRSLEKKYYRAVDALMDYLETDVEAWRNSEAFRISHEMFVRTPRDFEQYYSIERSRLLYNKLLPFLRMSEIEDIRPRLGAARFDELKLLLQSGDRVDDSQALLLLKIKGVCVCRAVAMGLRRLTVNLFPEGVLQYTASERLTIDARQPALKSESEGAAQQFDRDAGMYLRQLDELLQAEKQIDPTTIPPIKPKFNSSNKYLST